MTIFTIEGDFITIAQFLKVIGYISSGGEVSVFLTNNRVVLNKETVFEKRKKIYANDYLEINQEMFKFV